MERSQLRAVYGVITMYIPYVHSNTHRGGTTDNGLVPPSPMNNGHKSGRECLTEHGKRYSQVTLVVSLPFYTHPCNTDARVSGIDIVLGSQSIKVCLLSNLHILVLPHPELANGALFILDLP
jgi:hypothetical protein